MFALLVVSERDTEGCVDRVHQTKVDQIGLCSRSLNAAPIGINIA